MRVLTENKEVREIVDRLLDKGQIKLSEALILLTKEIHYQYNPGTWYYRGWNYGTGVTTQSNPTIIYTSSNGKTYNLGDTEQNNETL